MFCTKLFSITGIPCWYQGDGWTVPVVFKLQENNLVVMALWPQTWSPLPYALNLVTCKSTVLCHHNAASIHAVVSAIALSSSHSSDLSPRSTTAHAHQGLMFPGTADISGQRMLGSCHTNETHFAGGLLKVMIQVKMAHLYNTVPTEGTLIFCTKRCALYYCIL